ncbi:tetratricopeptide repeat protein [Neosynechococcus sphagnicola]|uniref:tetratricopeptide repeat protein n=1 Tax=Neosynechococcus sphagnicola TaxID=1501145 RepID=UPI00068C7F2D|nr:tetratricopeptide repeat protein [Neosynechococcus sphagnicola]
MKRIYRGFLVISLSGLPLMGGVGIPGSLAQTQPVASLQQQLQQALRQSEQRQFPAAIATLQQALQQSRQLKSPEFEALILTELGRNYYSLGQPQLALEAYQQALPILQALGNQASEATTWNNLGTLYEGFGATPSG